MALWLVATPIGTLGDASPRMREVIAAADVVYCEDTRTTRKLLGLLEVAAPDLQSLHAHNEAQRGELVAQRALTEQVVLVSDAGTPAVSDPGQGVVAAAHALGVQVLSVPGPSALPAALAASGFPCAPSTFMGFPPRKGRESYARELLSRPETLVLYEAPNRVADLCTRLAALQPNREACMCREVSKRHEEVLRMPLGELAANLSARERVRGEVVLVVGPGEALAAPTQTLDSAASLKDIAAVLAERWGVKKREAYQRLLALESE